MIENFTDNDLKFLPKLKNLKTLTHILPTLPTRLTQATKLAFLLSIGTFKNETRRALQNPEGYYLTSIDIAQLKHKHHFYRFTPYEIWRDRFDYTSITQVLTNPFKLIDKIINDIKAGESQ